MSGLRKNRFLNRFGKLWFLLKDWFYAVNISIGCDTKGDDIVTHALYEVLEASWEQLCRSAIDNRIRSMPRHLQKVQRAQSDLGGFLGV